MTQSASARDAAVIAEARRRRRKALLVEEDGSWLRTYNSRPARLLSEMASRGLLYRVGHGRYVIAELGDLSEHHVATWQVLADAALHPYSPYYVGYLTALIEHHLTDLDSAEVFAAVARRPRADLKVASRTITTTVLLPARFFGIELVRVSRSERYSRSDIERTLIDCLDRPRLCGSAEVWLRAWERALRQEKADLTKLCEYAIRLGPVIARRSGFLLTVGGRGDEARELLAAFVKPGGTILLDSSLPRRANQERDTTWGIGLNVTRDFVEGMFAYGK